MTIRRDARRRWLARSFAAVAALASLPAFAAGELANLPDAISRIKPSIVAIGTFEPTRNPGFTFQGTGFAIGDGSLVATNSHVAQLVLDPTRRETVAVAVPRPGGDAVIREAVVVARDAEHDVSILKLSSGALLPPVRLGDSGNVREGALLAFTGFPIGAIIGLYPATHRALVSAITPAALPQASTGSLDAQLIRRLRGDRFMVFQLDATAYPGNSGSPLFDPATGEVVGIMNMVFVKGGKETALTAPSGISYAIPAVHLAKLLAGVKSQPAP